VWGSSLSTNLTRVELIGRTEPRSWERSHAVVLGEGAKEFRQ
jgi:hypothetical protein